MKKIITLLIAIFVLGICIEIKAEAQTITNIKQAASRRGYLTLEELKTLVCSNLGGIEDYKELYDFFQK